MSSCDFVDVSLSHFIRGVVMADGITNASDSEVHLREDESADEGQAGSPQHADSVVNPSTREKEKKEKKKVQLRTYIQKVQSLLKKRKTPSRSLQ